MSLMSSPNFLRNVLWADAVSCLGSGLLQLLLTGASGSVAATALGTTYVLVQAATVAVLAELQGWVCAA